MSESFDDGNWHITTIGQFIALLVDAGDMDVAVTFRVTKDWPKDEHNQFSRTMVVDIIPNGHVKEFMAIRNPVTIHKHLQEFINHGLVK